LSQGYEIFERIGRLLAEGGIAPTPSNYEFWFRYVTGSDPDLVEAVNAVRSNSGKVGSQAMARIRMDLFGNNQRPDRSLNRLVESTQKELSRISGEVEASGVSARDYRGHLDRSQQALSEESGLDQQRELLLGIVHATSAMIDRTASLEAELAASSEKITTLKADLELAQTESRTDPLTGLANRKAGANYLDAQLLRCRQEETPISLIYCDIDHFKHFNDCFGHRLGDEILRLVGQSLERSFHGKGFVARWGGEEFLVVLPGCRVEEARQQAEVFRTFVASRTVKSREAQTDVGRITLSLGVAQMLPGEQPSELIDRADRALYCAKSEGRNRVVVDEPPPMQAAAAA